MQEMDTKVNQNFGEIAKELVGFFLFICFVAFDFGLCKFIYCASKKIK
jgi:hypothetical protein